MSKRILIVDDSDQSLYMLRALLEGHGYEVTEARDGDTAWRLARSAPPDAVVTDLMMPGLDGFTLCRRWMNDDRLWRVPFVVYTATYTDDKDRKLALDLGADAYLLKPSEPEDLLREIESAMERAAPKPSRPPPLRDAEFFERHANRLKAKLDRKLDELADTRGSLVDYVARCEAILDASPAAIVSTDTGGRIRTWNYAAEQLFGYAEAEALGSPLRKLVPDDQVEATDRVRADARASKRAVRFETRRVHQDGRLIDVSVATSYLGPGVGYIEVVTDLGERRQAEREHKRLEDQLRASQRLESVGRLAGGVAHDFNNMLTVILSHARFLEEDLAPEDELHTDARRIVEAGERATQLTRQLLAFSRQQAMRLDVLDLNQTVRGVVKMLRRLLGEDVDLRVNLADDAGRVEADVSQLEQVLMNLAVNARDAMPGGGRLIIETKNATVDRQQAQANPPMRPGRFVMLSVADTGEGMDDQTREQAFDPFFTTKELGKGTGLGLATVYGIVKQSQGFILLYSEPGRGTVFKIYLPRVDKPLSSTRPPPLPAESCGRGEVVLVVEDDDMVRDLARRILERAGYRPVAAGSSDEALGLVVRDDLAVDLLLTDVVMPGMSGRDLAARLQQKRPSARVVFMSGYTADVIGHHGELPEGSALVEKPFSAEGLLAVVRGVLDGEVGGVRSQDDGERRT